jgi:hypothetical protein
MHTLTVLEKKKKQRHWNQAEEREQRAGEGRGSRICNTKVQRELGQ